MSAVDNSITRLIAYAAIAIALIGNLAVFAYSQVDQHRQDSFLRKECARDNTRDQILIGALKDAEARARASIGNPRLETIQIAHLQKSINALEAFNNACIKDLS
jgi:hypothetical protein